MTSFLGKIGQPLVCILLALACASCAPRILTLDDIYLGDRPYFYWTSPADEVLSTVVTGLQQNGYEISSINRQIGSILAKRIGPLPYEQLDENAAVLSQISVKIVDAPESERVLIRSPTPIEHLAKVTPTFHISAKQSDGSFASCKGCVTIACQERDRLYKSIDRILALKRKDP